MDTVTGSLQFAVGGKSIQWVVEVPNHPVPLSTLLPAFYQLTEILVEAAEQTVTENGKHISCQKGCGACCRQLVPISPSEVSHLRSLLDNLPTEQRQRYQQRFQDITDKLASNPLCNELTSENDAAYREPAQLGLQYFVLGLACPFLDDESCGIHPHRPAACREFLVTSPASACTNPTPETVQTVPIPVKISRAIAMLDQASLQTEHPPWVALTRLQHDALSAKAATVLRTGPEWINKLLELMRG